MHRIPLLFFSCLFLLSSCAPAATQTTGKIRVAATFYPLASLAEKIGGDLVEVAQIVPPGEEPHEYEPTPQDLIAVQSSKIFLFNGQSFDPWAERIQPDLETKGITMINATAVATETAQLLPTGEDEHHEEDDHNAEEESHDESAYDPHIWLDPLLFRSVAERIRDALIVADPADTAAYRQRAEAAFSTLSALDREYRSGLRTCALRDIITSHNAFAYLADRYGFTVHAIAGITPDDDPSPKRIAELAELAKQKKIDTIFFETLVSPKLAETIAKEVGAKTAVLNPIEGLTEEERQQGKDYAVLMRENLAALRSAMKCQ